MFSNNIISLTLMLTTPIVFSVNIVTTSSNAVDEFLSPEHNKTGVMWYSFNLNNQIYDIYACEDKVIKKYDRILGKSVLKYNIDDDVECINNLVLPFTSTYNHHWTIPVKGITKNNTLKSKELEKKTAGSDPGSNFCNWTNRTQFNQTPSKTWTKSKTVKWSITTGAKVSSKTAITVPLVSEEINIEASVSTTLRGTETITESVTAESQKVEVPPGICREVIYVFMQTKTLFTFGLDVEVDAGVDDKSNDVNGDPQRYRFFQDSADGGFNCNLHLSNNITGIGMDLHVGKEDKIIIYNVPIEEIVDGYSVLVQFKDKPLPKKLINDDKTIKYIEKKIKPSNTL